MELSRREVELLIEWARAIFTRPELDWSIEDDDLLERLYQHRRALSTN